MRLIFWVTALAVLSTSCAKNSTKTKPKRQLESLRTAHGLQYSLVLPHSRVTHFRSLPTSERRISHNAPRGKLPPYAVQMEPVVQYSQKDPLYDPSLDNIDSVNDNRLYAQSKISNIHGEGPESSYEPTYGSFPTAPLYSQEPHSHHQYYEAPEPIIEIIIKESNDTLPPPPPQVIPKKKKEPVHVFYVKYSKDPHNKDKVIYEKPIPAITPPSNEEDDHHHQEYVTVTPEPYIPVPTTTLRAIIKPESEIIHTDSNVKITFGSDSHHYGDRSDTNSYNEDHEETAPKPAIAYPQQNPAHPPLQRSAPSMPQEVRNQEQRPQQDVRRQEFLPKPNHATSQSYRLVPQNAQSRIQFQPTYLFNEQQLPRQGPSVSPFRPQPQGIRQNPFLQAQTFNSPSFASPSFANVGPTVPGPIGPTFQSIFPRLNNIPPFHPRPSGSPTFAVRPHFNGSPRPAFHSGPQRPFHQPSQAPFFDEAKYLQENYHTITTDQVEPPKEQLLPSRPQQSFNLARPGPSPAPGHFQENFNRPQVPLTQELPHQRPPQHFAPGPSVPPFLHLKPSPPQIENNRPFQQNIHQPPQQQFSFHQGVQNLHRPAQSPTPSPIPQTQFLPQPSPPTFNFRPHPSQIPEQQQYNQGFSQTERPVFNQPHGPSERPAFQQQHEPSERPKFHQHQGPTERPAFHQPHQPTERPQFQQQPGPSERPQFQQGNFHDPSNRQHQQNVGQFVPNGGELVPAIPKYEQHIIVSGPTAQPNYSGLSDSSQQSPSPAPSSVPELAQSQHSLQQYKQQPQQSYDPEEEQARLQLAQNVQKQQEEIRRLQNQLLQQQQQRQQVQQNIEQQIHQQQQQQEQQYQQQQQQHQQQQQQRQQQHQQLQHQQHQQQQQEQQQHQQQQYQQQQYQQQNYQQQSRNNFRQEQVQASTPKSQYSQYSQQPQSSFPSSTTSPPFHSHFQSTARTVDLRPTTPKYSSSTANSISSTPEAKKEEKKRPAVELPDEVPDDLRQQLLSSGILDNADISILDYDKVGDTPLESLPPDQLANFFSAGGAQQIAASEPRPIIVSQSGDKIQSRIDDQEEDEYDQEIAASENIATYAAPPPSQNQAVEMKVVHFNPKTAEGQQTAMNYVKDDATHVDPVTLNDKKYNRYLPLKVSGNQFPLPDILKGRKVTSVVVLAPVETEVLNGDHKRVERAATENLKGIKFVAGETLKDLLKNPTKDNFEKWLATERKTASDLQSVILLVTGNDESSDEREIFMYDISSGNVNKLSGELSNAFVEAAENNSLSRDIEKLAIEGQGTPEKFDKDPLDDNVEASENVPFLIDLSGVRLEDETSNQVSISSGYSKMKLGRALRRH